MSPSQLNAKLLDTGSVFHININVSSLSSSSSSSCNCTMSFGAGIPNCIVVTGAGEAAVNGTYWWNGTSLNGYNSHRYIRTGVWKNMLCHFHIFICPVESGSQYWFLSIVTNYDSEGTEKDIDFYSASTAKASVSVPPRDGWNICGTHLLGYAPYPQLHYQQYDCSTGLMREILDPSGLNMCDTDCDELLLQRQHSSDVQMY